MYNLPTFRLDALVILRAQVVHKESSLFLYLSSGHVIFNLTLMSSYLRVLCDLNTGLTPRGAHTLPIFSFTPFMYGRSSSFSSLLLSLPPLMSPVCLSCSRVSSGCAWWVAWGNCLLWTPSLGALSNTVFERQSPQSLWWTGWVKAPRENLHSEWLPHATHHAHPEPILKQERHTGDIRGDRERRENTTTNLNAEMKLNPIWRSCFRTPQERNHEDTPTNEFS